MSTETSTTPPKGQRGWIPRHDTRCVWRTRDDAYRRVQGVLEDDDRAPILPRGHSAMRNERGVDGITCGVCKTVHPREEVRV